MLFTSKEMGKITGMSESRIASYRARKLLIHTEDYVGGVGTVARYDRYEVIRNCVMFKLCALGLKSTVSKELAIKAFLNKTDCTVQVQDISITISFADILDKMKPKPKRRNIKPK